MRVSTKYCGHPLNKSNILYLLHITRGGNLVRKVTNINYGWKFIRLDEAQGMNIVKREILM